MDCSFLKHFVRYSPHSLSGTFFALVKLRVLRNDFSVKLTQHNKIIVT